MGNMYFKDIESAREFITINCNEIFSEIYKFEDNKLIKIFSEYKSFQRYPGFCSDKLLQFKDINIDGVSFVKGLVYCQNNKIFATITEYVNGKSIDKYSLSNYSVQDVVFMIKKLYITIRKISDLGIFINDISYGNMVCDGNLITLIDTAEYYYSRQNIDRLYFSNIVAIMNFIYFNIFDTIEIVRRYLDMHTNKYNKLSNSEYIYLLIYVIEDVLRYVELDSGTKLNNFNDLNSFINDFVFGKEEKKCKKLK